MSPALTKGVLVVKKAEFFDNVIHYEIDVNRRLCPNVFLVRVA